MGGRSGSGGGGGGGSASGAAAVRSINRTGLLAGSGHGTTGFRDQSFAGAKAAFAGLSAKAANQVAIGQRDVAKSDHTGKTRLPAVHVTVTIGKRGGMSHVITDGRHRAITAKAAGATHIRAQVRVEGPRGGARGKMKTVVVKL